MLKQTLLATAATTVLLGPAAAFAAGANMGTGTITFSGSIIDAPCSIEIGDDNLTIDLGQISKKLLSAASKFSSSVPVNIHLKDCSFDPSTVTSSTPQGSLSKVGVSFFSSTNLVTGTDGYLLNNGSSRNVYIQLLQADSTTPINFMTSGSATGYTQQLLNGGTNNMVSFFVRLIANGAAATSGTVKSQVTYALHYY